MTSSEALKRSEKSQNLKVFHLEDSPWYYVESEEGENMLIRLAMKAKRNISATALTSQKIMQKTRPSSASM